MEGKFDAIEMAWIKEVLQKHGRFLSDLLSKEVAEKQLHQSGSLQHSIAFKTGDYGLNPHLSFSFMSHGRFIEINWHKKSRNSKVLSAPNTNELLFGVKSSPVKQKKKNTLWYARNIYGSLNRLIGIIMYELSDEQRARLKAMIEQSNVVVNA